MGSSFNHNKRRNVGLVYELLVRQLGQRILEDNPRGASQVMKTIKDYYSNGPLALEKESFDVVCGTRGVSEQVARKVIAEVGKAARLIDANILDRRRTELLHEINKTYGRDFFGKFRIPEYRLLASVQIYLDGCRVPGKLSESVQKIQLEEGMTKWMMSEKPTANVNKGARDSEIDDLVVKFATKKFEEKYSSQLTGDQRALLEGYSQAILSEDFDKIAQKMLEDKKKILETMDKHRNSPEISSDAVTKERFEESYNRLRDLRVTQVNDENMEEMLLFWKLSAELSSNE